MKGRNDMPDMVLTQENADYIIFLLEAISGALIEITWILKAALVLFFVFKAWGLVRK